MNDLTIGSVGKQIWALAGPIAAAKIFQILYFMVDLFFIARLGDVALAGVSTAGTMLLATMTLMEVLAVATVTLISHASGRKDRAEIAAVFKQCVILSTFYGSMTFICGYLAAEPLVRLLAADEPTVRAGVEYLHWFLPGLAITQCLFVPASTTLRGTGVVKPATNAQILAVVIHVILAPVLIAGWGTGKPFGVAGAGLASTIAMVSSAVVLLFYFLKHQRFLFEGPLQDWKPKIPIWRRIVQIGVPSGAESALGVANSAMIYWLLRDFGAAAQAGFTIGSRLLDVIMVPAKSIAFAAIPVAGQNFGAQDFARVRRTFNFCVLANLAFGVLALVICQVFAPNLIHLFTSEPPVVARGIEFLRIASWTVLAQAVSLSCWALFRALGSTGVSLTAASIGFVAFASTALWLQRHAWFDVSHIWLLMIGTAVLHAVIAPALLRTRLRGDEVQRRPALGGLGETP